MRITFHAAAILVNAETAVRISDSFILSRINGWRFVGDSLYNYLDMELIDAGIVGGNISAAFSKDGELSLIVDYWAPSALSDAKIGVLHKFTRAQMEDGFGEGGFELSLNGKHLVLHADLNEPLQVVQVPDNVQVQPPSKIALAARDGKLDALKALMSSGPLDSKIQGYTALHLAILYGHRDAALLLVSHGADPNATDRMGITPLACCVMSGSLTDDDSAVIAEALIAHGADLSFTLSTGHTLVDLAKDRDKSKLVNTLKKSKTL